MPARIVSEEILTCPRINKLGEEYCAEALFYRLMLVADDFGRFDAHATMVGAKCYPLRYPQVSDWQAFSEFVILIESMISKLADVGLVFLYESDSKRFGVIYKWRQRCRSRTSFFPSPPPDIALAADVDEEIDWKALKSIKVGRNRREAVMRIAKSFAGTLTERQERAILMLADKCARCPNTTDLTLDHVIPVSKGGKHIFSNVQILCRTCNSSKGATL